MRCDPLSGDARQIPDRQLCQFNYTQQQGPLQPATQGSSLERLYIVAVEPSTSSNDRDQSLHPSHGRRQERQQPPERWAAWQNLPCKHKVEWIISSASTSVSTSTPSSTSTSQDPPGSSQNSSLLPFVSLPHVGSHLTHHLNSTLISVALSPVPPSLTPPSGPDPSRVAVGVRKRRSTEQNQQPSKSSIPWFGQWQESGRDLPTRHRIVAHNSMPRMRRLPPQLLPFSTVFAFLPLTGPVGCSIPIPMLL